MGPARGTEPPPRPLPTRRARQERPRSTRGPRRQQRDRCRPGRAGGAVRRALWRRRAAPAAAHRRRAVLRRTALGAGGRGRDGPVRRRGEVPPARGTRAPSRTGRDAMTPDDLGFEPLDDALGRSLRAAAPSAPDAGSSLEALRPQLARARRQRRGALAGVSGVAVAALATLVVVLAGGSGRQSVHVPPATRQRDHVTTTVPSIPTSTAPAFVPIPQGTGGAPGGGGGPASGAAPVTQSYSSPGGSITVRLSDGAVSLVSSQPAAGFTPEL